MYQSGISIELDYLPSAALAPRWGHGQPPHQALVAKLEQRRQAYVDQLSALLATADRYTSLPVDDDPLDPAAPSLGNKWLPGLDSFVLYSMIATRRPSLYLEVGSGNSTKFARRSITDGGLETRLVSIDPAPRAEIDALCDKVYRQPLEMVGLDVFDQLGAGDLLFFDGSHRCFMNSDVTVFFLEVLPKLPPGVIVHIHDIYLPYDYPPHWVDRYYSEQYVLAAFLLGGAGTCEVLMPNAFVSHDPDLLVMAAPALAPVPVSRRFGSSFWLVVR